MSKIRIYVGLIGFLIVLYFWITDNSFSCQEYLTKSVKPLKLNGIIKQRYINESNRNKPILVISSESKKDIRLPLYSIHDYLYDACSEGDSLVKEVGSTIFTIFKPSGDRKEVILDCRNVRK